MSEGLLPAHKVTVIEPFKGRFTPTRATPREVLRDLGTSDGEIAAYLRRFSDIWMTCSLMDAESRCSLRISADAEHAES